MRKYLNQKGSAMVLVLASLMLLMAVGSVIVAVSAANISMSRRYSDWSAEYYWLDYAAQDQLGDLDQNVLLVAENLTREYLQGGSYQLPEGEVPTAYAFLKSSHIQGLIYGAWHKIDQDYQAEMARKDEGFNPDQALTDYNEKLKELVSKSFDVVYYAYLADQAGQVSPGDSTKYADKGIVAARGLKNAGWFSGAETAASLDALAASLKDLEHMPVVEIRAKETAGEQLKQVTVSVTLVPPSFSAVQQTRYYAVKANPLYANALSVGGKITFAGGNVTVTGDVVSNNLGSDGKALDTKEGNSNGITAEFGARATINGNVYSAGDLHLVGDNSSITVNPSTTGTRDLKEKYLYPAFEGATTPFALDLTEIKNPEQFMEGKTEPGVVPYLFKDSDGGNVYCNSLAVERGVTDGSLSLKGNLWTRDDIQNDARGPASITVDKRYIGLRSDAQNGDPNGSSAIINNAYMYGGKITVKGDFIIPGTTFYQMKDKYYQSAESGTARAGEYFSIYMKNGEEPGSFVDYTDADGTVYSLFEGSTGSPLNDKSARFRSMVDAVRAANEDDKSGIKLGSGNAGYTLGVVNGSDTVLYRGNDSANYLAYTTASASGKFFDQVFASKTGYFGTQGTPLSKLYDPDLGRNESGRGFHYYQGSKTLNGGMSGILFCEGDLTLTGGTYRGAVICTGDLTLRDGAKVVYDETALRDTLGLDAQYRLVQKEGGGYSGSSAARRFFSPGGYSAYQSFGVEQVTMLSTSAGQRAEGASRYIINSWRESKRTD